jgi:hypothetical protein
MIEDERKGYDIVSEISFRIPDTPRDIILECLYPNLNEIDIIGSNLIDLYISLSNDNISPDINSKTYYILSTL